MGTLNGLINRALSEVGYLEKKSNSQLDDKTANAGSANYTKYGRDMHKLYPSIMDFPAAWCDCFVDWLFYQEFGVTNAKGLLGGDFNDYTVASAQLYKNKNAWYTSNPKVGDQIFFKNSSRICHTGLVIEVTSTHVITVEGNTSSQDNVVVANGGCTAKKKYLLTNSRIAGYGRPAYAKFSDGTTTAPTVTISSVLKLGSSGSQVKELQQNLETLGFDCGGADGVFGNGTLEAVKKFQKTYGLQVDGKVGSATQAKIKEELEKLNKKLSFTDVKENDFFYEAVKWAVNNNITSGKTASQFMPNEVCTRAEAITFLWRAAGKPSAVKKSNPFVDVKTSDYFYNAVLWAIENGITAGSTKDRFMPDNPVLRGQFISFLYRYKGKPSIKATAKNTFTDVNKSDYFYDAVIWAVENKITSGTSATTFSPDNACSRAQAITFLWRIK